MNSEFIHRFGCCGQLADLGPTDGCGKYSPGIPITTTVQIEYVKDAHGYVAPVKTTTYSCAAWPHDEIEIQEGNAKPRTMQVPKQSRDYIK